MVEHVQFLKFLCGSEIENIYLGPDKISEKFQRNYTDSYDLANDLKIYPSTFILCSLTSISDLSKILLFVSRAREIAPESNFKILVINFLKHSAVLSMLSKIGVEEVVDHTLDPYELRLKFESIWFSLIPTEPEETMSHNYPNIDEPLLSEDDIWLVKDKCKRILGLWLVRVIGPGPFVGQWEKVKNETSLWKFTFKSHLKADFMPGDGEWYFHGAKKPEFLWRENTWLLRGEEIDLFYVDSLGQRKSRLSIKDGFLKYTQDSEFALDKESLIAATFDQKVFFKNTPNSSEQSEIENETQGIENFSSENQTEHIKNEPLRGTLTGLERARLLLKVGLKKPVSALEKAKQILAEGLKKKTTSVYTLEDLIISPIMTCELIQLNQSYQCHLDDYFGTKMFFVSQSNLQPGPVKMHMSFLYLEHSEIVVMEGKIISLEAGFIGVEIKPSDIFTFMPFMRIYNERQDNIKIFMKLASGQ